MSAVRTAGRVAAWSTVGIVATSGVAAYAASTSTTTPAPAAPAVSSAPAHPARSGPGARRERGLATRALHGSATLPVRGGTENVDFQRGTVVALTATTVLIRSADGFTAGYTVGPKSRILGTPAPAGLARVHPGEHAWVLADRDSAGHDTVLRLRVTTPRTPGAAVTPRPSGAA